MRIEVTTGMCSCDFYCGDAPYGSANAKTPPVDAGSQFAAAVETLVKGGAHVTLLAHDFDGLFIEPFEIVGTTQLPLAHYVARGNYFPEDTLVSLLA